jgi:hypothetical protein
MAFIGVGLLALWWNPVGIWWGSSVIRLRSLHRRRAPKPAKSGTPPKPPADAVEGAENHSNSTNTTITDPREPLDAFLLDFSLAAIKRNHWTKKPTGSERFYKNS